MNVQDSGPPGLDREAWRLATEFDRAARTEDLQPELLAAVATSTGTPELLVLLRQLDALCLGGDELAARRYGEHLAALAALLPDRSRRAVLAAVDMGLAAMCARAGQREETALRVTRAGPDVTALLPRLVMDREWLLGGCAEHEGRIADARAHWTRARTLFADAERWLDAAGVARLLARLAGAPAEQALADWRDAAALFGAAGEPGVAQRCVLDAHARLMDTVASLPAGDEPRVVALAEAVRRMAIEHGLPEVAADLGQLAATMAIRTPEPWDVLAARFDRLRVEGRALGGDAAQVRLRLAGIDLREGMAAAGRGRVFDAESLLVAALEVFGDTGRIEDAQVCESALGQILALTDHDRALTLTPAGRQTWQDPIVAVGAPMLRALSLATDRRFTEAIAEFAEASRLATEADAHDEALACDAYGALLGLLTGDRAAAQRSVDELDRYFVDNAGAVPATAVLFLSHIALYLRVELARVDGDDRARLTHLERLEELLTPDARLLAARTAVHRARLLHDTDRAEEALRVVLPAVLALDAVRFTLPDARRRHQWAVDVADGFDTAFRAAATCGGVLILAELIEVARGNAVPLPRAADAHDDAVSALSALLDIGPRPGTSADALAGAIVLTGGEERTVLGLPALLHTPWDTVALDEHLGRARRYHDPVRADVTVEWRVREVIA